ncbi:MAG: hypothetical protein QOF48_2781 [Verrucomicrobiota bacterium]|jgi:putative membrane-bound dehydrogenase-like protein
MISMRAIALWIVLAAARGWTAPVEIPEVRDRRLELTVFAAAPEIVTPIGLAIDRRSRVFVVESHTHFPKKDYPGPKHDRVKLFIDSDHDGKADRITVFADGLHHAMNLAFGPDGRLYVTHRNGVIRLDDTNGDNVCDAQVPILRMETRGDYPHNGIGGIAFSPDGWLYVGQGENLGEAYTLYGTDGRSDSAREGGNVFRCRPDGARLERVATGFWNPFGLAFYGATFLLAVDNDPDSRPPNRLLDVVTGGDYGFKFHFGRDGLHPFQAWNGELPGTLPMAGAVGEAASSLLACDRTALPGSYHEALLLTAAWDHRIEVARPQPFGASLRSEMEVLVQGGESFRPIALGAAPDGTVFFTDWVDPSYNVHGKGCIWKLQTRDGRPVAGRPLALKPNASRRRMIELGKSDSLADIASLRNGLAADDPFIFSAAVAALARPVFRETLRNELDSPAPEVRLGALLALRRAKAGPSTAVFEKLLADRDIRIRLMALIWAGEESVVALTNRIGIALKAGTVTPALLRAHAATEQILSKASGMKNIASEETRINGFDFAERPDEQRAIEVLRGAAAATPISARIEAVRDIAQTTNAAAIALLQKIARDRRETDAMRCEAIAALSGPGIGNGEPLLELLEDPNTAVRIELIRALRICAAEGPARAALERQSVRIPRTGTEPWLREQILFALHGASGGPKDAGERGNPARPTTDDEWRKALATPGNAARGRLVFFNPTVGCARCHRIEDHGGRLGPDLSTIARGADREKMMQSILHPSRDIAPQFVSHTVETKGGETVSGLLISQNADGTLTLATAEGRAMRIPGGEVVTHSQSKTSMMPEGLDGALAVGDFRDLITFLLTRR